MTESSRYQTSYRQPQTATFIDHHADLHKTMQIYADLHKLGTTKKMKKIVYKEIEKESTYLSYVDAKILRRQPLSFQAALRIPNLEGKNDTAYLAQSRPAMAQGEKGTILAPSLVAI